MGRRDIASQIRLQDSDGPSWAGVVRLAAPPVIAPTAGIPVELDGVRWSSFRAPRDTGPGMFELQDSGEFQQWAPRGRDR